MTYDTRRRVQRSGAKAAGVGTAPGRSTLTRGLVQRRRAPVQRSPVEGAVPPKGETGGNQGPEADAKAQQILATMKAKSGGADDGPEAASAEGGDGAAAPEQQQDVQLEGAGGEAPEVVHEAAAHGTSSGGGRLPHHDAIQRSFGGDHDLSGVNAHVGGAAAEACDTMGASAYATGNDVAFASEPNLHTAAHEAAHVVQQRQGVQLYGGVGEVGDAYEQEADAVADRVVAGESAADLLGATSGGGAGGVQQRAVQRDALDGGAPPGGVPDNASTAVSDTAPGATRDKYKIELKAWIPHHEVVDPEEPIRASNWLDTLTTLSVSSPLALQYVYSSRYRGDNHAGYDGTERAKATLEFEFDGTNIVGPVTITPSGATASHRHYWYRAWVQTGWGLGPDLELTKGDEVVSGPAGGGCTASASGTGGQLSIAAPNLLIMGPAPDINSDMSVQVNSPNDLVLGWSTDLFPSHGYRVWKNGGVIKTEVVNDASGVNAQGVAGGAILLARLSSQSNIGVSHVKS